jgi:hypothetical protein
MTGSTGSYRLRRNGAEITGDFWICGSKSKSNRGAETGWQIFELRISWLYLDRLPDTLRQANIMEYFK